MIPRRTALAAGLAGAGTVALAACSTSSGSSDKASSDLRAGKTVAKVADIKVGEAVAAKIGGTAVIVSRPTSSTVACFSAVCTHQGCTVQPAGAKLECPCHGSVFDALTGAVLGGPAPTPLPKIAVTVANGDIVTSDQAQN